MTPTAQAHAEHLACSIASAEDGLAWAQELRRSADMARVVAKARADNMSGLSAERIQADLQWRNLTLATIDLHLEEVQLLEKLERIRAELSQIGRSSR